MGQGRGPLPRPCLFPVGRRLLAVGESLHRLIGIVFCLVHLHPDIHHFLSVRLFHYNAALIRGHVLRHIIFGSGGSGRDERGRREDW